MISEKENIENNSVGAEKSGFSAKISDFGLYLFMTLMAMIGFVGGLFARLARWLGSHLARLGAFLWRQIKRFGAFLAKPFARYAKAFKMGRGEIRAAFERKGFLGAAVTAVRIFGRVLFGKRGVAVTLCNYALPVLSCVFLFNIVTYANSMTYALKLSVNGNFIGYINDETVFTDAEKIVQQRISYTDENKETVTMDASYEIDMVGFGSTLTKYQLADKLLSTMDAQIEYGYGMYIDSAFYGAMSGKDEVEATLESLLDKYRTGAEGETVAFESDITFEPGLYLTESMVSEDSIIKLITSNRSVAAYYTAVEGDSPSGICSKLDMTYEELEALNPGFSEDSEIFVGDKFLINQEEPFLAVAVTRLESYDVTISYETVYYDDDSIYTGNSIIEQEGENGTERVNASVSYINGTEVRRKVLTRLTTKEPVDEIIAVGTKARPTSADSYTGTITAGLMIWPVGGSDGGEISEMMYGYGGYVNHSGVDIAAPYGTAIYAADSGRVTLSQWYYGYGYCIMIQHDNGLKTLYGHCSALHVSVGEYVTQGQQIADVGATGQAYGNHLHFEVRINDTPVYPLSYVPWHKRQAGCVEY
jgi:murein DD-endopeptidase MepM/ murein hydrolase activator NlpD